MGAVYRAFKLLLSSEWHHIEEADLTTCHVILLSLVGKQTYKLMSGLHALGKPREKSYEELCTQVRLGLHYGII